MSRAKSFPQPGDILKNPQRMVSFVDRNSREFRCSYFSDPGPGVINGIDWGPEWGEASFEDGWTELPTDHDLEGAPE